MAKPYSPKQKAEAIDLWKQHGTAETARQTGISTRTIKRWVKADPTAQADTKQTDTARRELARRTRERRERIRSLLLERTQDLLEAMHPDASRAGDIRSYAVAVGILIDKFRLEMGEATGRSEQISVEQAVSRLDEEIAEMLAEMEGT